MCETPVKPPVNTGEQPPQETAPSLTEANGQSQPSPEVVPLVSSPAEDRAQPPPEQVAPPTATDVCPELSSSGDSAPLPAAEVGDSVNISVSSNPVTSGSKPKAHRKRKRFNGDTVRNVKKKSTKAACPESPRDASSPVVSNDDIPISPRIPRRRRGETRYTTAKQQLNDALEETVRLKTVIKLLESEIDLKNKELTKLRKIDVSQKSEIKKLSIPIDYQKHELHKDIATDQDVPDHDNSSSSSKACDNSTEVPVSVNRRRRKSTKVVSSRQSSVSISKSSIDSDASMSQSDVQVELSPSALPCPQVAVTGTSIIHGVGLGLNKRGVDALTFTYPGCEVPQITERISSILTKAYQPDTVVLQCGGNDLQYNRSPAEVMEQIDILVKEVRRCRPGATVVVNKIPPRGRDDVLLQSISYVNNLISDMARDSKQSILCLDPCPKMFKYYANDEIHLNRSGKRFFVYQLAKSLINFHWPQLQETR